MNVPLKRLVDPHRPLTYGIVQAGPHVPDGVPYIRPVDMTLSAGVRDVSALQRTNPDIAAVYARSAVRAGDIVLSIGPSYGKVMVVLDDLAGANLTQGTARIAAGPGVHTRWLYWALQSRMSLDFWAAVVAGGTFSSLNLGPLAETPLPIVEQADQKRIADFLDVQVTRIDKVIDARRESLLLLDAMVASRRRRVVLGSEDCPTDLTWAPKVGVDRRVRRLSQLARLGTGHTPSRSNPEYWETVSIPWLTTADVHKFREDQTAVLRETELSISELGLANSAAVVHPAGTVALSRTASAGFAIIMGTEMATSQDFATWTCGPELRPGFLLGTLRVMRDYLLGFLAMGSTHKTIYFPDLEAVRIPVPPLDVQDGAVAEMMEIDADRADTKFALIKQISLLAEYKQSLITAAVTGGVDVTTSSKASSGVSVHQESAFEASIEAHLLAHDWGTGGSNAYDRKLGLFPDEVVTFLEHSQPKEWAKLRHDSRRRDQRAPEVRLSGSQTRSTSAARSTCCAASSRIRASRSGRRSSSRPTS